jgi:hypothetical protein
MSKGDKEREPMGENIASPDIEKAVAFWVEPPGPQMAAFLMWLVAYE